MNRIISRIPINTSPYFTKQIKRSWKERLFTLPWKPWKKYNNIPDDKIYIINGIYYCHPQVEAKIEDIINDWRNL